MHIAFVILIAFLFSVLFVQLGRKIGKKLPSQIPSWDPLSLIVYFSTPTIILTATYILLSGWVDMATAATITAISILGFIYGHAIADVKYYTIKMNNQSTGKPDNKLAFIVEDKKGVEHIQGQKMIDKLRTCAGIYDTAIGLKEIRTIGDEVQHGRIIWAGQKNVKYCATWTSNRDKVMADVRSRKESSKKPFSFWRNAVIMLVLLMCIEYGICYASEYANFNLFPYLIYMWIASILFVALRVLKNAKLIDLKYSIEHTFTASDLMNVPDDQFYHEMKVMGRVIEGASAKIHDMREEITTSKADILAAIDVSLADDFVKSVEGDALEDLKRRVRKEVAEDKKETDESTEKDKDEQKG